MCNSESVIKFNNNNNNNDDNNIIIHTVAVLKLFKIKIIKIINHNILIKKI